MTDTEKNCLSCKYNPYYDFEKDWFDCVHPITIKRGPHWEKGDPAMVSYRTGDVRKKDIGDLHECPTWEPRP